MAGFPSIVLFGDSLTEQSFSLDRQGFAARLSNDYVRRADVVNRGLSGYNSDWLLPWLTKILSLQVAEVLLWVVWVGANDACLPEFVYHVPLERYRENLHAMVSMIRSSESSTNSQILFITPPPIDVEMLKKFHRRKGADRRNTVTAEYAAAAKAVAAEAGVKVLDFYRIVLEAAAGSVNQDGTPSLGKWMTDGLHLGPKGYSLLYESFVALVKHEMPEIQPKNVPMQAPWVGGLDVVKEFEKKQAETKQAHDEL